MARWIVLLLLVGFVLSGAAAQESTPEADTQPDRRVTLVVPETINPDQPVPLIVALHGAGDTGDSMSYFSGLSQLAQQEGFLVAYPDGIENSWNDGRPLRGHQTDDVAYLVGLVEELSAEYSIDPESVFLVGFSNGGMMAHRVACEAPGTFAAIATIAGTFPTILQSRCDDSVPTSILVIHGFVDSIVPWEGDAHLESVVDTLAFWGTQNQCADYLANPEIPTENFDARGFYPVLFRECAGGSRVGMLGLYGAGHGWPGAIAPETGLPYDPNEISSARLVWAFFSGLIAARGE